MSNALYENDNYRVDSAEFDETNLFTDGRFGYTAGYVVINKTTEIIEHVCVQLPEACFTAFSLDSAMKKSPWDWAANVAEALEGETVN